METDDMQKRLLALEEAASAATGISKTRIVIYAIIAVFVLVLIAVGVFLWNKNNVAEEQLQKAVTMAAEQATNANYWQNQSNMNKQNAEMTAAFLKSAIAGQVAPSVTFLQTSPTVEKAAETVAERINAGDKTLPAMALQKTDRTAVVPQEVTQKDGTKEWQVGVYKVNNYKNWEWGGGVGWHGGDTYYPISLQRNFNKDRALEAEYHAGGKEKGGEVKYKIKTDKLLGFI